jgi:hypothetical protein
MAPPDRVLPSVGSPGYRGHVGPTEQLENTESTALTLTLEAVRHPHVWACMDVLRRRTR